MERPKGIEEWGPEVGSTFHTTHWSVVLAAGDCSSPASSEALSRLCQSYWYPLYVFARRRGHPHPEAEDLTQEFFARLLDKQLLCGLQREGGRFRSYLLNAFKCFLVNVWNREHAQKRGGGRCLASIDGDTEARYQRELVDYATPETLFERQWALTVLGHVFRRLQQEYHEAGKPEVFERLQGCLPGSQRQLDYGEAAAALQLNEAAVRKATQRLRQRYGELLRAEIASTVSSATEIDDEIRFLIGVLGNHAGR